MLPNEFVSVAFMAAIFIEFSFLADFRKERKKTVLIVIATALFSGLASLVPFRYGMHQTLGLYVLSWGILFCFLASLLLGEKIVPALNERTFLIVNMITLYLVFKSGFPPGLLYAYGIATALAVMNAIVSWKIGGILKIACFAWYFILLLTIPLVHFDFGSFVRLVTDAPAISYSEAVALGATLCFVIVQYVSLLQLLPLPARNETASQAYARAKEYAAVLISKYSDTQLSTRQAAALISFVSVFLAGNYYWGVFLDSTVLAIAMFSGAVAEKHG